MISCIRTYTPYVAALAYIAMNLASIGLPAHIIGSFDLACTGVAALFFVAKLLRSDEIDPKLALFLAASLGMMLIASGYCLSGALSPKLLGALAFTPLLAAVFKLAATDLYNHFFKTN